MVAKHFAETRINQPEGPLSVAETLLFETTRELTPAERKSCIPQNGRISTEHIEENGLTKLSGIAEPTSANFSERSRGQKVPEKTRSPNLRPSTASMEESKPFS
jgi:hypothetical protein